MELLQRAAGVGQIRKGEYPSGAEQKDQNEGEADTLSFLSIRGAWQNVPVQCGL
jgi:hypothetical protein